MLRWQEIIELLLTPFPSLEQQFSTRKTKSGDLRPSNTGTTNLDSRFLGLFTAPVKGDTDLFSELPGLTPSANDYSII
jgi:hypothetical protein